MTTTVKISICGNGLIDFGEVCDAGAGNNNGGYSSSTAGRLCAPGCESFGPYCGDGILQVRFAEECDDGNQIDGDLCSPSCKTEPPVPPAVTGSPPRGSIPDIPGGIPGTIPSEFPTKVILRGKAYPLSNIQILADGKAFGTTRADSNADFSFSATNITPGTITFSFIAKDSAGRDSILNSVVFEVIQSAVTTVSNIFIPPTISVSKKQVSPGELVTFAGQSVPSASITTKIDSDDKNVLSSDTDTSGNWALQLDTGSIQKGQHSAKSSFMQSELVKSGYGKSVSFTVGEGGGTCGASPDENGDSNVNLVDFSIFLTMWGTDEARSDFNCDSKVNLADFSIMLFNWTG